MKSYGDVDSLKLEKIVDPPNEDGEMPIMQPSLYHSFSKMPKELKTNSKNLNIFILNPLSINAKFDNLKILIKALEEQNIKLHAICIQESWLVEDLFQLDGYRCFAQGKRCSPHGGLITYLDPNLNATVIDNENNSPIWESLFVSIKDDVHNKAITLGNIYRPHEDDNNKRNIDQFTHELDLILSRLCQDNADNILIGDFNINLLKIYQCSLDHFGEFLDLMLGYSLFASITLPTRITAQSCTLIDNALCKLSAEFTDLKAGIILSDIFDHYPYFVSIWGKKEPISKRKSNS